VWEKEESSRDKQVGRRGTERSYENTGGIITRLLGSVRMDSKAQGGKQDEPGNESDDEEGWSQGLL